VACRAGRETRHATCHTYLLSVEFLTLLGTRPVEAACKAKGDFRYGSTFPYRWFSFRSSSEAVLTPQWESRPVRRG
jgi:hypothetical protein